MTGSLSARFIWLACALAAACSSSSPGNGDATTDGDGDGNLGGGQTGEEDYGCIAIEREEMALASPSALGFSGADVLAALGSRQSRTLTYEGGATTPLELSLEHEGGTVELLEREFRSDGSGREIAADCGDVVAIALTLGFVTDDGAFDETWPVTLIADTASTARVFHVFDPGALSGSFVIDRGSYDDVSAYLALNLVGMTWTGSLEGQGEDEEDSTDPDAVVSSTAIPIGTF